MKKINGFWTDSNGNKWDCELYTKAQSIEHSESLIGCVNCIDCSNCSYCRDCSDCRRSRDCSNCRDCRSCSDCSNCSYCRDCRRCSNCNYCRDCSDYKSNPNRICKELQGSVKNLAQVYWIKKDIQIVFGCWKGFSIIEFEEQIEERVTDPKNKKLFLDFVEVAKYNIKNL